MPIAPPPLVHIFRLTHYRNVPWILDHGLCCRAHPIQDPDFINIGNRELVDRRADRVVPVGPAGVLNDYVPFYFGRHSVMLYQIHTGRVEGVTVSQAEVVYLVSSIEVLRAKQLPFVFTDGHAFPQNTRFLNADENLAELDWATIRSRDFRKRPDDPDRQRRYQAECLVHRHLPTGALLGIACLDVARRDFLLREVTARGLSPKVEMLPRWYF